MSDLMPTKLYVNKAGYVNYTSGTTVKFATPTYNDGVFVEVTKDTGRVSSFGPQQTRIKTPVASGLGAGGLNMDAGYNGSTNHYMIGFGASGSYYTSGYYQMTTAFRFYLGGSTDSSGNPTVQWADKYTNDIVYKSTQNPTITIYKTELTCPTEIDNGEITYATGFSIILSTDGSPITKHQTFIVARVVDMDGSGFPEQSNGYCYDGSVVFSDDGSCLGCLKGRNATSLVESPLSQSIPDSAIASNDGLLAVSCIVGIDGYAKWVGYKNGIYKLYQKSEPLYGMPGEKVTIKGHDFVCLAYSPFYARLS